MVGTPPFPPWAVTGNARQGLAPHWPPASGAAHAHASVLEAPQTAPLAGADPQGASAQRHSADNSARHLMHRNMLPLAGPEVPALPPLACLNAFLDQQLLDPSHRQAIESVVRGLIPSAVVCFYNEESTLSELANRSGIDQLVQYTVADGNLDLIASQRLATHAMQPLGLVLEVLGYLALAMHKNHGLSRCSPAAVATPYVPDVVEGDLLFDTLLELGEEILTPRPPESEPPRKRTRTAAAPETAPALSLSLRIEALLKKHMPEPTDRELFFVQLGGLLQASRTFFHAGSVDCDEPIEEQNLELLATDLTLGCAHFHVQAAQTLATHADLPLGAALTALGYLALAAHPQWSLPSPAQSAAGAALASTSDTLQPGTSHVAATRPQRPRKPQHNRQRLAAYTTACFPQTSTLPPVDGNPCVHPTVLHTLLDEAEEATGTNTNHRYLAEGRYHQHAIYAALAYKKLVLALAEKYPQDTEVEQAEFTADMLYLASAVGSFAAKYKKEEAGSVVPHILVSALQVQFRVFGTQQLPVFDGIRRRMAVGTTGLTQKFSAQLTMEFARWTESYLASTGTTSSPYEPGNALNIMQNLFFGGDKATNQSNIARFGKHVADKLAIPHARAYIDRVRRAWNRHVICSQSPQEVPR
jgi:hypothetical protein